MNPQKELLWSLRVVRYWRVGFRVLGKKALGLAFGVSQGMRV